MEEIIYDHCRIPDTVFYDGSDLESCFVAFTKSIRHQENGLALLTRAIHIVKNPSTFCESEDERTIECSGGKNELYELMIGWFAKRPLHVTLCFYFDWVEVLRVHIPVELINVKDLGALFELKIL
jgi:hypothetical protein